MERIDKIVMRKERDFKEIVADIRASIGEMISEDVEVYLRAMSSIDGMDEQSRLFWGVPLTIVSGFLADARKWKGADAKRIKRELRKKCRWYIKGDLKGKKRGRKRGKKRVKKAE